MEEQNKSQNNFWMYAAIFLGLLLAFSMYTNYRLSGTLADSLPNLYEDNSNLVQEQPSQQQKQTLPSRIISNLQGAHLKGNPDAKVIIVEYSDFECPFCARVEPALRQVMDAYGKDVAIYYKHFPLSFHPNAQNAALASECAAEQDKFWEYHEKLFTNQQSLGIDSLKQYAKDLSLNSKNFDSCLDSKKYLSKVSLQMQEGANDGVDGTPAFLINGIKLSGAQPFEAFKQIIDSELN